MRHAPAIDRLPGIPREIEQVVDQLGHVVDAAPDQPHKGRAFGPRDSFTSILALASMEASGLRRSWPSTAMTCSSNCEALRSFEWKWFGAVDPYRWHG